MQSASNSRGQSREFFRMTEKAKVTLWDFRPAQFRVSMYRTIKPL